MKLRAAVATLGLMLSMGVYANNQQVLSETMPTTEQLLNTPMVYVSAVEVVGGIVKVLDNNVLVRSNPNHRLCWQAEGLAVQSGQVIEEVIWSPAYMQFIDPEAQIYSTNNGTLHTIHSWARGGGDSVGKCWQFDSTDPVGNYTLAIKVGDVAFPALSFSVEP